MCFFQNGAGNKQRRREVLSGCMGMLLSSLLMYTPVGNSKHKGNSQILVPRTNFARMHSCAELVILCMCAASEAHVYCTFEHC
jgi:hypothetical protein